MSFNLSCTAQDLNAAVTKANAAAPQSTTYTKAETNTLLNGKQDTITIITDTGTMTNSTTITDTGVTVDIPADSGIWELSACVNWIAGGAAPVEVQIRCTFGARSTEYLLARMTNANDDSKNFVYLSASCTFKADPFWTEDADKTVHVKVFAKNASATETSGVMLIARKIAN